MMTCPKCDQVMLLRTGKYGEFYFCMNQKECGQKTISANTTFATIKNRGGDFNTIPEGFILMAHEVVDMLEDIDLDWLDLD